MENSGVFKKFISYSTHTFTFSLCVVSTLFGLSTQLNEEAYQVPVQSSVFNVPFVEFSPAFAAFEDEFLFDEEETTVKLVANKSSQTFDRINNTINPARTRIVPAKQPKILMGFDGSIPIRNIKASVKNTKLKKAARAQTQPPTRDLVDQGELKFGSLAATVSHPKPGPNIQRQTFSPQINRKGPGGVNSYSPAPEQGEKPDLFTFTGNLRLRDGLAFLGSMEISWVVGDYELQRGAIYTVDGTYEIEVSELIGDIIVSLYDSNDELIGEGLVDLAQYSAFTDKFQAQIDVRPIDWDHAGQVIHVNSLGTKQFKPVEDTSVELYAFNEASQTDQKGNFFFYNWKKANSKTLAIASKKGFKDSIFLIDSKRPAQVVLFDDAYIDSFFQYLKTLGLYDIKDKGLIYGSIAGTSYRQGYKVHLEKYSPIYFMDAGFATRNQKQTSSNGLFAFAGLDDGDYELTIEKEGQVVDRKIVIVEQGKVSPVIVDIRNTVKHLEFFDPFEKDRYIGQVEVGFFDEPEEHVLDANNILPAQIQGGNEPQMIHFSNNNQDQQAFISRHKGLQRVPVLDNQKLTMLVEKLKIDSSKGVVIGFVQSPHFFKADFVENSVDKVYYFDEQAQLVDPTKSKTMGFIMTGFAEGLHTLALTGVGSDFILATDLVYSNSESISIVNIEIIDSTIPSR